MSGGQRKKGKKKDCNKTLQPEIKKHIIFNFHQNHVHINLKTVYNSFNFFSFSYYSLCWWLQWCEEKGLNRGIWVEQLWTEAKRTDCMVKRPLILKCPPTQPKLKAPVEKTSLIDGVPWLWWIFMMTGGNTILAAVQRLSPLSLIT